jgi:5'-nucleotidase
MNAMKIVAPGLALMLAVGFGCSSDKKGMSENRSVTEIAPPSSPSPSVTEVPIQTVPSPSPAASSYDPTITPPPSGAANGSMDAPASGATYVVKKGDTLYSIAKAHYGSGKEYTKIVAANPGVSAKTLKVGQKLVLP